jgi:4-amino-4-deoxy-L-arabinose transferase-like glycosyltransferase
MVRPAYVQRSLQRRHKMDSQTYRPESNAESRAELVSPSLSSSTTVLLKIGFAAVVVCGILVRLFIALYPGNAPRAPWSGGGDTSAYITLAENIAAGRGLSYAGEPSAFRPPGYPLILAASIKIFGRNYIRAVRVFQFFESLLLALLCAAMARRIRGDWAGALAFLTALCLPTLLQIPGEILTETTAASFTVGFLYCLVRYCDAPRWQFVVWMFVMLGVGTLVRSNMVFVGPVALAVIVMQERGWDKLRMAVLGSLIAGLLVSPWIVRNLVVFHRQVLFSTQGGFALMAGVLIPQGRALPGDTEKVQAATDWNLPEALETNNASRNALPPEPEIDKRCRRAAVKIWQSAGWKMIPMTVAKLSYFWLSTDQLFWTGSFSRLQRALRCIGVLTYWTALSLATLGLVTLRRQRPALARAFLLYMFVMTLLHLPFNMNTRYRIPLVEPLVVVLAGISLASLLERWRASR